jgi:hypothetical protein
MIKTTAIALILTFSAAGALARQPAPEVQRANFKICAAQDESWMRRFGNYVVSFDFYPALDICHSKSNGRPYGTFHAGCYIDRKWAQAGYYCNSL